MSLTLRYAVTTPGRSIVALETEDLHVAMHATDATDALGDLVRAVITLLEGATHASVVLEDAPGVHEWNFAREEAMVRLQVHSWADRRSGRAELTMSQERTVAVTCSLQLLARELVLIMDVLWVGHGPDGWTRLSPKHPFPARERRRLQQFLAVAARRGDTMPDPAED